MKMRKTVTYDDVLLVPQYSDIRSRKEVNIGSFLDKKRFYNLPIISSPMETVTESSMATAMSLNGGFGVVHRYNTILQQVDEISYGVVIFDKCRQSRNCSNLSRREFLAFNATFNEIDFCLQLPVELFNSIAVNVMVNFDSSGLLPRRQKKPADSSVHLIDFIAADGQDLVELALFANVTSFFTAGREIIGDKEGLSHACFDDSHEPMLPVDQNTIDIKRDSV